MRPIIKCAGLFCLLALLASAATHFAQDAEPLTVVGSGIANSVVESLAEANATESVETAATGTLAGLDLFCAGNADIAAASRAITAAEDAICAASGIVYSEFLIAHSILAFVSHPEAPLTCLTESELDDLFKPSAAHQLRDWSSYDENLAELPIVFITPPDNRVEYIILDSLIAGDGLRRDVRTYEDRQDAISQVSQTEGAIAAVSFSSDLAAAESLALLDLDDGSASGCVSPSAQSVENRQYQAARSLFLYVNRARLEQNPALASLIGFGASEAAADVVAQAGFTPPTSDTYALNASILRDAEAGRLFSGAESQFTIPDILSGQIDISGSASAYGLLDDIARQLAGGNEQLNIQFSMGGQSAGIQRLCNGETDIAVLESELAANALDDCDANHINAIPVAIGTQATVLVGNAADEHVSCLTTDQIRAIWNSASAGRINAWSDLDESFPQQDMILFGSSTVDQYADILMKTVGQAIPPIRRDTEIDRDPLYRAAAVGNVAGALTYMSWGDYQRALDNEQANIQLVSADGGNGCVRPSETSIMDGAYPLSRSSSLLVSESSLADVSLQSYLWRLFSEAGWSAMTREGFIGLNFVDLAAARSRLETQFRLAESKAAASVDSSDPSAAETDETGADSSD